MGSANRPFKFGAKDRREFIVEDSEVMLLCQNDSNGNPIYVGRAKIGSSSADAVWQIKFVTYDANQGVISVEWPENDEGNPSGEYEFIYDNRATYTYA